jgi:glycine/D-amino acid oxidase-like deaminating enzyme
VNRDYRSISLWMDTVPDPLEPRAPLGSSLDADVAIVGAGFTGLWTAYYLARAEPALRIAVIEREIAGFGASGRNGGWCSALFAAKREAVARRHGPGAAIALQRALFDTVDEVARVCEREGFDVHLKKGGTLSLVTSPSQLSRAKAMVDHERSWGFTEQDAMWLDASEARSRIRVPGCLGGAFTPHCASIHPARLVRGLARVVERMGVALYEQTSATAILPRRVKTSQAEISAGVVVRATEGYSAELPGLRRSVAPLYSLMIATEPLPDWLWNEVGWSAGETVTDGRHLLIYAQRTQDDRIAIGGRGAPYHFGSRVRHEFDAHPGVFSELKSVLRELWPAAASAEITHEWGGPLAVPRDWYSSVGLDRSTGMAWAGGYVGDGVATSNLAGRTLADLILERDSDLVRLPWVNHVSPRWEPEPLRWLGINAALKTFALADGLERRTGRPATRAVEAVARLIGS